MRNAQSNWNFIFWTKKEFFMNFRSLLSSWPKRVCRLLQINRKVFPWWSSNHLMESKRFLTWLQDFLTWTWHWKNKKITFYYQFTIERCKCPMTVTNNSMTISRGFDYGHKSIKCSYNPISFFKNCHGLI